MTPLMVVVSSLRPPNILEQPNPGFSILHKEIASLLAISLFFGLIPEVDHYGRLRANIGHQECVPVAQWIEHLPCWSLNGE